MPGKKGIVKSVYDKAMKGRKKAKAKPTTKQAAGKRRKGVRSKKA